MVLAVTPRIRLYIGSLTDGPSSFALLLYFLCCVIYRIDAFVDSLPASFVRDDIVLPSSALAYATFGAFLSVSLLLLPLLAQQIAAERERIRRAEASVRSRVSLSASNRDDSDISNRERIAAASAEVNASRLEAGRVVRDANEGLFRVLSRGASIDDGASLRFVRARTVRTAE